MCEKKLYGHEQSSLLMFESTRFRKFCLHKNSLIHQGEFRYTKNVLNFQIFFCF